MRALVLGGTGMLGGAVAALGRRYGHAVLALGRNHADVTDADRLSYWIDSWNPRVIINCAAFTRVDDCETEHAMAYAVNGTALDPITEAAAKADADLIHVSTDYVFPGNADTPYREDDPTDPPSVYGASKLDGETRALRYDRTLVVRTSWLFGPGGPNFVATMRRLITTGKTPLRVVDDQVGCPTYTPFLARALWQFATRDARGIVHYANRHATSWHGFATEIAQLVKPGTIVEPVPTSAFPRPAPRPAYSVLAVDRAESLLGRRVEPWSAGLDAYLNDKTI
ncbi:MAG: dTDP-4-dehydrorhamnose reductase [Acidobacteriota bacterium]